MNFTKKNYLALLAATLLAAPAISAADNLIEIQDPANFIHKETVEISIYEGDPAKGTCLLYTSPSPRDGLLSRMPSSA